MDEDEIGFFSGQFTGYDYLHKIRRVVNHLIRFADEVMNTTGVEDLLVRVRIRVGIRSRCSLARGKSG